LYTPAENSDDPGHYDLIIGNERRRVESDDSNCLYHAFAYGRDPSLSRQDLAVEAQRLRTTIADSIDEMPQSFAEHIRRRQEMDNFRKGNRFILLGAARPNADTKILSGFYNQSIVDDKIYTMYRQANGVVCKAVQKFNKNLTVDAKGVVQETDFRLESFEIRMEGLNLAKAKGKRCWDTKPVVGMIKRYRGKGADSEVSFHLAPSRAGANAGDQYANAIPASPDYNKLEMAIWTQALQTSLGGNDFTMVVKGNCGPLNKTYQGAQPTTQKQDAALAARYQKITAIEPRTYQMLDLNYEIEMPAGITTSDLNNIRTSNTNSRLTVTSTDNTGSGKPSKISIGMGADNELFTPRDLSTRHIQSDGQLHNNELNVGNATKKKPNLTVGVIPRYKQMPSWGGLTLQDSADFAQAFDDYIQEMETG